MIVSVIRKLAALCLPVPILMIVALYYTVNWGRITEMEALVGIGFTFVAILLLFLLWSEVPFDRFLLNGVFFWTATYVLAVYSMPKYPLLALVVMISAYRFEGFLSGSQRTKKTKQ